MPSKSRAELLAENKLLRRGNIAFSISSTLNTLIRYGSYVLIAMFIYLAIASLAGQETKASIVLNFLGNLTISQWAGWLLAGGSTYVAVRERKLRKDTTEKLASRNEKLERGRDSKRSSSRLTKRGDTHPRDKEG
jgi:hypothetical protein